MNNKTTYNKMENTMNTIEQQILFSTNWKKYHEQGSHKPKPYIIESGLPEGHSYWFAPQTHMVSDLTRKYYAVYNFLRGLPISRGFSGSEKHVKDTLSDIFNYDYWEYHNRTYRLDYYTKNNRENEANAQKLRLNTLLETHQNVFGKEFTLEILGSFLEDLKKVTR